jgi:hypothetical protein
VGYTIPLARHFLAKIRLHGESEWFTTRSLRHPRNLLVDMASTIFLVHTHGVHYLHLSVPAGIQPPNEDQWIMEEPQHRNKRNPILDDELMMGSI